MPAKELGVGTSIVTRAGPPVKILSNTEVKQPNTVYNLTVADFHTYFVGKDALWVHNNCPITTVIGRMEDLEKYRDVPGLDHWWESGRIPGPGEPQVDWLENLAWLTERIERGDNFAIATDPATLPRVVGGFEEGKPNGYFTARELRHLQNLGIEVLEWF